MNLYHCPKNQFGTGHAFGYGSVRDSFMPGRKSQQGVCEMCGYTVKFITPVRKAYEAPAILATAHCDSTQVDALALTLCGDPNKPAFQAWLDSWVWAMGECS